MLSALVLKLPLKVLFVVADYLGIRQFCGGLSLLFADTVIFRLQRLYLGFPLFWRYFLAIL